MLVTFLPMNQKLIVDAGGNLYQVASDNGIDFGGVCSGNKTCGKCKAMITKGNNKKYRSEELKFLTEEERNSGIRLTCCFTITEDTCVIVLGKDEKQRTTENDNKVQNDFNRCDTDSNMASADAETLKGISKETSKGTSKETSKGTLGIAFDIGTTSVAARLWDMDRKKIVDEISTKNPQSLYGADVIARITYANINPDNLRRLTYLIRECCNTLLLRLALEHNIKASQIKSAVIVANTTMSHLFLGKSVEKLAKVPFQGISYEGVELKASDIGFHMHPNGQVYVMPGIAGQVGSDTLGCILAKDLNYVKGNHLLVDIGTNGEIVLAKEGELIVCSTAAGPAFEGASLYQGMGAIEGAISKVNIKKPIIEVKMIGPEKGKTLTYKMNMKKEPKEKSKGKPREKPKMGPKEEHKEEPKTGFKEESKKKPKEGLKGDTSDFYPIGICGSGAIEAASELLSNHIMDETGRLLGQEGEKNFVTLWKNDNKEVILTQKDIRELQLAKGAIYAGIILLLKEAGLSPSQLNHIDLAGAFGSNIDFNKAIHIGLLPHIGLDKINYIGNGALDGASKVLLGEISKSEAENISKKIKHLELALCEDFQEEFLKAMNF